MWEPETLDGIVKILRDANIADEEHIVLNLKVQAKNWLKKLKKNPKEWVHLEEYPKGVSPTLKDWIEYFFSISR